MPARRKTQTLAEQLANLEDPAPADFDIENAELEGGGSSDSGDSAGDSDNDESRSHYVAVGKSRLRDTEAEKEVKGAYKGIKSSRKDIFSAESADQSEDFLDQDEDAELEESGSEGDMAAFDAFDREDASDARSTDDSDSATVSGSGSDQSDFEGDSEDSEEEDEINSEDERQANELKKMLADDQKAMVQEVIKTATADAEKGKAVKLQLAMYDSLLDARIKLQKGLQTTNLLCEEHENLAEASEVKEVEKSALELLEELFTLREDLMAQDFGYMSGSRKRKYNDGEDVDTAELWRDMQEVDSAMEDWRDKSLAKWSNKIQRASGLDKGRKFKALNQGILAQIEESKSDREKLLKRTQVKRYLATDKSTIATADTSASIYDDGDFYSEMLKDLIDSRMLDSTNTNQMKWMATKQPKQKKADVDTRASKGRKLRYHVHEKIQNFMPPVPTGTWHEEQIDELFGSLLGQALIVDEEVDEPANEAEDDNIKVVEVGDDFRLFG